MSSINSTPQQDATKPGVYGVSIVDLLERQKDQFGDLQVPQILTVLSEGIVRLGGLFTEGIFRIAGPTPAILSARKQIDKGDYALPIDDVHILAALLKQFLRDLPEPLICSPFYVDCISNVIPPVEIFDKLPPPHRDALKYVVGFLQLFTTHDHVVHNKMDSANLATIFAPVIFRCPYNDPAMLIASSNLERQFAFTLIRDAPPVEPGYFPFLVGNEGLIPPSHPSITKKQVDPIQTEMPAVTIEDSLKNLDADTTSVNSEVEQFTDLGFHDAKALLMTLDELSAEEMETTPLNDTNIH